MLMTSGELEFALRGSANPGHSAVFRDEVLGCAFSAKLTGDVISVWTRDASNRAGIDSLRATILMRTPGATNIDRNRIVYKAHASA